MAHTNTQWMNPLLDLINKLMNCSCHFTVQVLCNEIVPLHLTHPSVRSSVLPWTAPPGSSVGNGALLRDTSVALGLAGTRTGDLPVAKPSPYRIRHHRPSPGSQILTLLLVNTTLSLQEAAAGQHLTPSGHHTRVHTTSMHAHKHRRQELFSSDLTAGHSQDGKRMKRLKAGEEENLKQ